MHKLNGAVVHGTETGTGVGPPMLPKVDVASRPLPACLLTHAFPYAKKATCVHTNGQWIFLSKGAQKEFARIVPVYREISDPTLATNKNVQPGQTWPELTLQSEKPSG